MEWVWRGLTIIALLPVLAFVGWVFGTIASEWRDRH